MAIIPIIMPVGSPQVRDCIIEGGRRYCESNPMPLSALGWVLLGTLAFGLWFALWMWVSERYFDFSFGIVFGGGFGIPMLVGGLYLVLLT